MFLINPDVLKIPDGRIYHNVICLVLRVLIIEGLNSCHHSVSRIKGEIY